MKPTGLLPDLLPQLVSVHVTRQAVTYDAHSQVVTPVNTAVEMPLYEAVRKARYSLLLGELGSGKSTLAAELVLTTIVQSQQVAAVLVPAKELMLTDPLSPVSVLHAIAHFVRTYVALTSEEEELVEILRTEEVLVVIDGLDEISQNVAAPLLRHLAQLASSYAGLQVLVSARPVELTNVSFDEWKIIRTLPLQDAQRQVLFEHELLANGVPAPAAAAQAVQLLAELRALPAVSAVATTPLFVRLLYPKLLEFIRTGQRLSLTLGDLLHDIITTRLGDWAQRDEKCLPTSSFERQFTTALHKAAFLGQLAQHYLHTGAVPIVEASALLFERLPATVPAPADRVQLAREALDYAQHSGLTTQGPLLEFAAQPLAEGLAATAMATEWATSEADISLPAVTHWRVVAFAAALARHWHLQAQVRPLLSDYYRTLLTTSPAYLAAAAFIATEFQDIASAQDVLAVFDELTHQQLVYNYQGEERTAEAQTIAQMLLLAGQRGVEWLYKHYLNPKAPLSQMGSALVEEVIRQWVRLVLQDGSRVDVSSLAELVQPYRAYGKSLPMHLLAYLVLLFPDAFPLTERIYLLCEHLGDEKMLTEDAVAALRQIAALEESELVQIALLDRAAQHEGFGLRALALWLELQDPAVPELPPAVVEGAFRAVSLPAEQNDWDLVNHVRERLGEQAWQQHARWALSAESGATAAGAAQALYQAGQTNFWLLGGALLRGLDDFRPSKAIEQLLGELLLHDGEAGDQWLANHLSLPAPLVGSWKKGLEASQWRLLLASIASLADGPQLLAKALANLGVHTLPHYPEVREQFARVLDGPRGEEFQVVLRGQLLHSDVELRWGAAAVLLTYDPLQQSEALLVTVQTQPSLDDTANNWGKFCLSLSLGPIPLQKLQENLPMLPQPARLFALVVLYARRALSDSDLQNELFRALLSRDGWSLNYGVPGPAILADPVAKSLLLTALNDDDAAVAERAGEGLRSYHFDSLTLDEQADCLVKSVTASNLHYSQDDLVARLRTDTPFAAAVSQVPMRGTTIRVLQVLARAIADSSQWATVLWEFMHQPNFRSFDDEDLLVLYSIGQRYTEYRQPIGKAAIELREDKDRWRTNYQPAAMQWLMLLADEFLSPQPPEEIEAVLALSFETHRWSNYNSVAARALLARIPSIPETLFNQPRTRRLPTKPRPVLVTEMTLPDHLMSLARDTSAISPTVPASIYKVLCRPPFEEDFLAHLSHVGSTGQVIALALRFCYGRPARLAEAVGLFDGILNELPQDNDKSVKYRLRICRNLARVEFMHQPDQAPAIEEYIQALDQAFAQDTGHLAQLAIELLNTRGTLLPDQLRALPRVFTTSHASYHPYLLQRVCDWLAASDPEETQAHLLSVIQEGIIELTQFPAVKATSTGPAAYLLFSFAYWAFENEPLAASQEVFLTGLKLLYTQTHSAQLANLTELLTFAEPLFVMVPPHAVRKALTNGITSHDAAVRQLSRLLTYFVS